MHLSVLILFLQDDPRELSRKAIGNLLGEIVVAKIRLDRDGKEADWVECEKWEKSNQRQQSTITFIKGRDRDGVGVEAFHAIRPDLRCVFLMKKGQWEKQDKEFGGFGRRGEASKEETVFSYFHLLGMRVSHVRSNVQMDTSDVEGSNEIWKKVRITTKEGVKHIVFPGVDGRIGELIKQFDVEDEVDEFEIDRSKISVTLRIDDSTAKLQGIDAVTHYSSSDRKKSFTIRLSVDYKPLEEKHKVPEQVQKELR